MPLWAKSSKNANSRNIEIANSGLIIHRCIVHSGVYRNCINSSYRSTANCLNRHHNITTSSQPQRHHKSSVDVVSRTNNRAGNHLLPASSWIDICTLHEWFRCINSLDNYQMSSRDTSHHIGQTKPYLPNVELRRLSTYGSHGSTNYVGRIAPRSRVEDIHRPDRTSTSDGKARMEA